MRIRWERDGEALMICDGELREKVSSLKKINPENVLDFGGGTGGFGSRLKTENNMVICVDIEIDKLKKCVTEPVLGDVLSLPFKPHSFDVVIARAILHHVSEKIDLALKKAKNALKDKGLILIEEPCYFNPGAMVARKFFPTTIHDPSEKPFNPKELEKNVSEYFEVVEVKHYCLFSYIMPHVVPFLPEGLKPVSRKVTKILYKIDSFLLKNRFFQTFCGYMYILGKVNKG